MRRLISHAMVVNAKVLFASSASDPVRRERSRQLLTFPCACLALAPCHIAPAHQQHDAPIDVNADATAVLAQFCLAIHDN